MSEANFASAEIELVIHATEDMNKVLSVTEEMLGINPQEFAASSLKGHFGNDIILLKANLNGKNATELAHRIARMINGEDRMQVHDNFDLYLDEKNSLHIRISKQKLFERKIVLSQTDALKMKFRTVRRFQRRSEMDVYRKFLVEGN
jgi:hypothetical protein